MEIQGATSINNTITGNYIGTDITGLVALGNTNGGFSFWGAGTGNLLGGNVVSGNLGVGVLVSNSSNGATIQGNYIGVGMNGSTVVGNTGDGIYVGGNSTNSLIGTNADGTNDTSEVNTISGNANGIVISGLGTTGTLVHGNYIGTDASGTLDRGNIADGINIGGQASGTIVGGTDTRKRNIISGNNGQGVVLVNSGTSSNTILGNYIGTNATGTAAIGNTLAGVALWNAASNNTIGGTAAGAGNLISGNGGDGLSIGDTGTTGNLIQGNLIGVNASATSTIGNGAQGIWIGNGAQSNTIGGTVAGAGNVVGGSTYAGIELHGSGTSNNIIQGNFIGTNSSGTINLGNSIDGILVTNSASNNTIGGTVSGAGNTIAFNGRDGVRIESTAGNGNTILGNSIYSNSGLGINLAGGTQNGFGVTSNDSGDGDAGANGLQNFPTISSAGAAATSLRVQGSLNSIASRTFRIEVFASSSADASGHGEGQRYIGTFNVTTDGTGNIAFDQTLSNVTVAAGEFVTMTATDLTTNNTSEFASAIAAIFVNTAPVALAANSTRRGGLSINAGSGNDSYLVADNGGAIFGGRSQFTIEMQFSLSTANMQHTFLSYAVSGVDNEVYLRTGTDGSLSLSVKGTSISSTAVNFNSLVGTGQNTLTVTWDNATGAWQFFLNGSSFASGTGLQTGATLTSGGVLVLGHDQDSVGGGIQSNQAFKGTLFDTRIFNDVRTQTEISSGVGTTLPYNTSGMVANWTFNDLSVAGKVAGAVSGNGLTIQRATGTGFVTDTPTLTLVADENSVNGTVVGSVIGTDADRDARITALLAADSTLRYNAETGKFYKLVSSGATWNVALSNAATTSLSGVNGSMVRIESAAENAYLFSQISSGATQYWIGASDALIEGQWRWYDGVSADDTFWNGAVTGYRVDDLYNNWFSNQPNDLGGAEDVARLDPSNGFWYDAPEGQSYGYIIQWNADDVLDTTNALTYSITSQTAAGAFTINSDTGVVTIADRSLLNFESQSAHSVTVRVTDSNGANFDQTFAIALSNVSIEPTNSVRLRRLPMKTHRLFSRPPTETPSPSPIKTDRLIPPYKSAFRSPQEH